MTPQYVIHLGQQAISLMLMISAPMLIAGLLIGLGVSILQAVTQVHEVTLTFIPKILAVGGIFLLMLPWIASRLITHMVGAITTMSNLGH